MLSFSRRLLGLAVLCLTAAACANNDYGSIAAETRAFADGDLSPLQEHRVSAVDVSFAPDVEILWCGERIFDCSNAKEHVAAIFREGAVVGAKQALSGAKDANLKIVVTEFQSITSVQRMATGGIHFIGAIYQLVDASGAPLTPQTALDFDRIAWGRTAALIASISGRTQRVRVKERIANVTKTWLTSLAPPGVKG